MSFGFGRGCFGREGVQSCTGTFPESHRDACNADGAHAHFCQTGITRVRRGSCAGESESAFWGSFQLRTCVYSRYAVLRFQLFQGFWSGPFMLDSRLELLDIH